MSLMVMGIGIVSVVTLFPIAALKSIQATQLTNAKMLRKNAEEAFRMPYQSSATPPVRFDLLNYTQALTRFRGEWRPNTSYAVGDIVVPTRKKGLPHPVPNRWFIMGTGSSADPMNSGYVEPNWLTSAVTNETVSGTSNFIEWTVPTFAAFGTSNYSTLNYVVDPMGWWQLSTGGDLAVAADVNKFGYRVIDGLESELPSTSGVKLLRLNGGTASLAAAEQVSLHPDSWRVEIADSLRNATGTTATFRGALDLSNILQTGSVAFPPRIVLTSNQSEQAIVRSIVAPLPGGGATDWTVNWTEPLPTGFQADGPARIESYEPRFSWMATVNKLVDGAQKVTLAVFFNRSFAPQNEHVYYANFGNTSTGLPATWQVTTTDQIRINWQVVSPNREPEPLLKEGNYILDGRYAVWYRIVAVTPNGTGSATLTVDRQIPEALRTTDPADPDTTGRVILMRGIIHLFEL